jgi:hypothetical protein
MKVNTQALFSIILASVWISFSEFVRNELFFKSLWISKYQELGIIFPTSALNGLVWAIWSLLFAFAIFLIESKFSLFKTALISWFIGFILMWVAIGNLGVLPYTLLPYAIPLSFIESFIATFIIKKVNVKTK